MPRISVSGNIVGRWVGLLSMDAQGDLLVGYYSCSQMIDRNLEVGSGPHPGKLSPTSIYLARVVID